MLLLIYYDNNLYGLSLYLKICSRTIVSRKELLLLNMEYFWEFS